MGNLDQSTIYMSHQQQQQLQQLIQGHDEIEEGEINDVVDNTMHSPTTLLNLDDMRLNSTTQKTNNP